MSLKQTAIEFLQFRHVPDIEWFRADCGVPAPTHAGVSVVAAVAVGGVIAGMSLTDILICGLVAGGGVALFCAVAGWLFDGGWAPANASQASLRWTAGSGLTEEQTLEGGRLRHGARGARIGTPARFVRRKSPICPPSA